MRVSFPVLGLVTGLALLSCTDKPKAAAPPPAKLGPIETPEDLLGTLLVRDVGVLTETNAGLLGTSNPLPDMRKAPKGVGEAVSDLDLHAPMAVVVLGDLRKSESWHFVAAGKLQHAQKTREKLASQQKGTDSAATGTTVFAVDKGAITVLGDYLVFGDTGTALDAAGRFVAREAADGTPPHDLVLHVSLGKFAGALRKDAEASWKEKGKDPDLGSIEPLERILVEAIGDLGDVDAWTDQDKENWSMEVRVGATGKLSDLLAAYPSAPVTSMMSLPKASSAGLVRFPDAMAKAWEGVDPAQSKSAWGSFVRSVGNELAFSFAEKGAKPGDPFREILLRLELADAKAGKAALQQLLSQEIGGKPDRKVGRAPWSKQGADGETLTWTENGEKHEARWAIKAQYLYFDLPLTGKLTLLDAAVDPNSKALFRNDPRSKVFEEKLPKQGLVAAYYGETDKAPKASELGAVATLAGVRLGALAVGKAGITATFTGPVADLTALASSSSAPAAPSASAAPPASAAPSGKPKKP